MEVLALDGAKLAYLGRGQGDPVVLIHGAAGQIEGWHQNIDDLADSFRVIAYDRRGHGRLPGPVGLRSPLLPAAPGRDLDLQLRVRRLHLDRDRGHRRPAERHRHHADVRARTR